MTALAPIRLSSRVRKNQGVLVVAVLLVILLIFGAFISDRFRTTSNILNIFEQSTGLALVSLGQTLAILTGGIDLSVGSMISLLSTLTSGLIAGKVSMVPPVAIGILLLGLLIGICNGLLIIWLRVHPLIVTLGMSAVLQGIVLLYSLGPAGSVPPSFNFLAYGKVLGLPIGAVFILVLFLLVALFLRYARLGRYIYAVGDDEVGARLMGLPRARVMLTVYGFSGFCCGLAAIYLTSRFSVGQPYTGLNYTLASITPVVVGGTLLSGGKGGVFGTLLGVYLISLLNNVLNFMDVSMHYQLIAQGLIVIAAVSVYVEKKKRV
ncbi:D-allose transporter subunit; membrane component of ABC superfamily [Mesorhizobium metallidurans STM 2683]|uniref:D-allose transporter subunit membrane component of ABC superfamily n=1 Tax=Mesorhizobium metallidurans STM 2683 TaxID=1297569 RepID=M5EHC6_9HYPH|nr:ABC transporter permease [Mesorhizobium metallidurans]CCV04039.1 D-allose transporter subunit; membrane component of ABC superfamily [Mesorhizobium metallidurans STM 2683]